MKRNRWVLPLSMSFLLFMAPAAWTGEVAFSSPGFSPSKMDATGRLVEDWGAVQVNLRGEGLPEKADIAVSMVRLDGIVPAARATSRQGSILMSLTAYRAPVWPTGVDVLMVRIEETAGKAADVFLSIPLPQGTRIGNRTVSLGGRTVLTLPHRSFADENLREWGHCDEAVSLARWARPEGECDPAFRNIRAGMGGVPISYRFTVDRNSAADVVLGFCESHWAQPAQRPLNCQVEGAPIQKIDPVSRWGQHKPGALLFQGKDQNGDGRLEVMVLPEPGAPDQNTILNAIWIFPPGKIPRLEQVISGKLNSLAIRHVDAGGKNDQSIYPPGKLEYSLKLPASGSQELTFYVASGGGSALLPERTAWTEEALNQAARDVWRDWSDR